VYHRVRVDVARISRIPFHEVIRVSLHLPSMRIRVSLKSIHRDAQ